MVVTMVIHNSNANTGDMHSYAGCAPGYVGAGLNVSFKTGGHNKGDHASGSGEIRLECGQEKVTYENLGVTVTVIKKWLPWPHLAKVYATQDESRSCSQGPTKGNVSGTAAAGNPPDKTVSECKSN